MFSLYICTCIELEKICLQTDENYLFELDLNAHCLQKGLSDVSFKWIWIGLSGWSKWWSLKVKNSAQNSLFYFGFKIEKHWENNHLMLENLYNLLCLMSFHIHQIEFQKRNFNFLPEMWVWYFFVIYLGYNYINHIMHYVQYKLNFK